MAEVMMTGNKRRVSASIFVLALLSACGGQGSDNASSEAATDAAEPQGQVERTETPAAAPVPAPAPAQTVIQTQPGSDESQVALNRVAVTGDVLTVQLTYTGKGGVQRIKPEQVSVIDDATAQQLSLLKDNKGAWLASPLDGDGDEIAINLWESPAVVWFKFPAPPPTSKTVSINIPEVAPFDGVPVTR
jgi:hypothetical protein